MPEPVQWCDIVVNSDTLDARCRCRCLAIGTFERVADEFCNEGDLVFKSGNYPITQCHGLAGTFNQEWAENIKPDIRALQSVRADYCEDDQID